MNRKTNLLFIMADQLRFDCLGVNGNEIVQTPNLDKFASESVNVNQYYVNSPVCVPSRATLFTGRYPHSHRIRENHTLMESNAEMHLFRILKQEGYRIGYVGKNHLLNDEEFFNFNYADLERESLTPENEMPFHHKYTATETECFRFGKDCLKKMEENGAYAGTGRHAFPEESTEPSLFTDSAIRFLEQQESSEQPFCLCVSWLSPHAPHIAPEFIRKIYDEMEIGVPEMNIDDLKSKAERYYIKHRAQKSDLANKEDKINFIASYYAMVTAIDRQFGRLMESLKSLALENYTIVVFTSDHGDFLFEHGMCKKDLVLTESLLHVPLIIRHKNSLSPRVVDNGEFVEEVDVLPTILEMLDIELPLGVQGKSALSYLQGKTERHKTSVYSEVCTPWQFNPYHTYDDMQRDWHERFKRQPIINVPGDFTKSIRTRQYRYVWYATGEEELYDLARDPREQKNIASISEYNSILAEHKMKLFEWLAFSEDPIDPLINDMNQLRFHKWLGAKNITGTPSGPYWLEQVKCLH